MQLKIILAFHLTTIRLATLGKQRIENIGKDIDKRELLYTEGRHINSLHGIGIQYEVSSESIVSSLQDPVAVCVLRSTVVPSPMLPPSQGVLGGVCKNPVKLGVRVNYRAQKRYHLQGIINDAALSEMTLACMNILYLGWKGRHVNFWRIERHFQGEWNHWMEFKVLRMPHVCASIPGILGTCWSGFFIGKEEVEFVHFPKAMWPSSGRGCWKKGSPDNGKEGEGLLVKGVLCYALSSEELSAVKQSILEMAALARPKRWISQSSIPKARAQATNDCLEKANLPCSRMSHLTVYSMRSGQPWNKIHTNIKQQNQ